MKKLLAAILCLLALTGCAPSADSESIPALPEDFAICFSDWVDPLQKNIFDTYEGRLQKDLVLAGKAECAYSADEETLRSIWEQLCLLDLCSIQREMTANVLQGGDGTVVASKPPWRFALRFRADGTEYTVLGDASAEQFEESDEEARRFMDFVRFMLTVVRGLDEFRALPDAEGLYE